MATYISNVQPDDVPYKRFQDALQGLGMDDPVISAVGEKVANKMGNSTNIWKKHYDIWQKSRDSFFTTHCMKIVREHQLELAKVGDCQLNVVLLANCPNMCSCLLCRNRKPTMNLSWMGQAHPC